VAIGHRGKRATGVGGVSMSWLRSLNVQKAVHADVGMHHGY
jgi:hypothetical protein